jgi:hypothetical protein
MKLSDLKTIVEGSDKLDMNKIQELMSKLAISVEDWRPSTKYEGRIDVTAGHCELYNRTFEKLPVPLGEVLDIDFSHNKSLYTLENGPIEAYTVSIHSCPNLKSLKYSPKLFDSLNATNNNFESLEGLTVKKLVNVNLQNSNELVNLKGCPDTITRSLTLSFSPKLKSLEGGPSYVGSSLRLDSCMNLESLNFLPKFIGTSLILGNLPKVKNYLPIFKVQGLKNVIFLREPELAPAAAIFKKYFNDGGRVDIISWQDEMIEAGFEELARTK